MVNERQHHLPKGLPPPLDLRTPPADAWRARHYAELLSLLEQLGEKIDRGDMSRADLRQWERQVIPRLKEAEIDRVMAAPEEDFDPDVLPEHRWRNLKRVLVNRKGLDVGT